MNRLRFVCPYCGQTVTRRAGCDWHVQTCARMKNMIENFLQTGVVSYGHQDVQVR